MHIALIVEKYPPDVGGLAISAQRLAKMLTRFGHSVQVCTPDTKLQPGEKTSHKEDGISINQFGAFKRTDESLAFWFEWVEQMHNQNPFDILHAFYAVQAGFVASLLGKYLNIPSVLSLRGNDIEKSLFNPSKFAHIRFALENASALTANTPLLIKKAKAVVPEKTIKLVPNGVDCQLFQPGIPSQHLRQSLGIGEAPVLGFIGEARTKKGLTSMLLAYRQVSRQKKVILLLIGGVRQGRNMQIVEVFRKQNPELPVHIIPHVSMNEVVDYYNLLDILLMPSLHDGLPNALLEGMACEKAIIATPVGGIPLAIENGVNGLLVSPNDVQALSAAILQLLEDSQLRTSLGRYARIKVMQEFTLEQELEKNLEIYAQLTGEIDNHN